jgi:hypothetical protein
MQATGVTSSVQKSFRVARNGFLFKEMTAKQIKYKKLFILIKNMF